MVLSISQLTSTVVKQVAGIENQIGMALNNKHFGGQRKTVMILIKMNLICIVHLLSNFLDTRNMCVKIFN